MNEVNHWGESVGESASPVRREADRLAVFVGKRIESVSRNEDGYTIIEFTDGTRYMFMPEFGKVRLIELEPTP